MKTFMSFLKSGTMAYLSLVTLLLIVFSANQSDAYAVNHSPATEHFYVPASLATPLVVAQAEAKSIVFVKNTAEPITLTQSPEPKSHNVAPVSALLLLPGMKRKVKFARRQGNQRAFTRAEQGNVSNAQLAYNNSGDARAVVRRFQNGAKPKFRRVRLTLTATANATPIFFDFLGLSGRTLTNVTVGGSQTTNTESGLRQEMGATPFYLGKVWIGVSVATMWNSIGLQFISRTTAGDLEQHPFDSFFIQNPMNTNTLLNITDPIELLCDKGFAMQATLLNGEILTLGFDVPEIVNTYAMSQA